MSSPNKIAWPLKKINLPIPLWNSSIGSDMYQKKQTGWTDLPYLLKKQKLLFNQTRNTQEINELVFIFHPCMSICSTKINICLHFAIIYLDRKSGDLKALISISDDRIFRTNMSSLHFLSMPPSLRFFSSFSSISCMSIFSCLKRKILLGKQFS